MWSIQFHASFVSLRSVGHTIRIKTKNMTEDEFLKDDYASDEEYQAGVDAALGHYDQEDLDSYTDRFNEED